MAAHLFFIYWAILGGVTPPTCTAAVAAAGIAKANWIKTGFNAVKLGAVAFILPYFFMLNPSLVGRTDAASILTHGLTAAIGAVGIAYFAVRHAQEWNGLRISDLAIYREAFFFCSPGTWNPV